MENQAILKAVSKLFDHAQKILLTAAENLDGDALGCLLSLEAYGRSIGKEMVIVNSRRVSPIYGFLGVDDRVRTEIPPTKFDLVIVCDTGDIRMIGRLYDENRELFDNTPLLNIDHHGSCYGDVCWMDPEYSAACDMVAEFIEYSGGIEAITKEIANFLFLGILFDTGCFRNSNTMPSTFRMSEKLLSRGADYMFLIRNLYQNTPPEYIKLYGHTLSNLLILGGGSAAGSVIRTADFERFGVDPHSIGNDLVNDYVRAVQSKFVFLIKEMPDGMLRMSFRSKTEDVDVRIIASEFVGGGHKMAAGGTSRESIETVLSKIEAFARTI